MSRDGSGNYTLPSTVNPTVTGTTITTNWSNTTLNDVASELTDSLNRSGKGAMLAPLQHTDGTKTLPSLTFANDLDTGIYRPNSGDVRVSCNDTDVLKLTQATTTLTNTTSIVATVNGTNVVTVGATTAITAQGTGAGAGINATGGSTSGTGVAALGGAPNGNGGTFTGDGTGSGLVATGGDSSGSGLSATGGAPNGVAITATGTGTGNALVVAGGYVKFMSGNPASTTGFTNTLTAMNLIKAWARVAITAGAPSVTSGFNISAVSISGNDLRLTLTDKGSTLLLCVIANVYSSTAAVARTPYGYSGPPTPDVTYCGVAAYNTAGAAVNLGADDHIVEVLVLGAQ